MKGIILIALLVLSACSSNKTTQPETPAPIEPTVQVPVKPFDMVMLEIAMSASTSDAAKYSFKQRGKAPVGYLKGMALIYARSYCKTHTVVAQPLGSTDKDALAYYGIPASNRNAYAFLIGLGMRESSGKYCEGRDMSASNTSSETAEAGMFQTSFNSRSFSPALSAMINEYHEECYLNTFKEGVNQCPSSSNTVYGEGLGKIFQQMARSCPAFAAEWAAITIRTGRKHYGPINRKEVEFRPEVVKMLTEIEKIVDQNPSVCSAL